MLDILLAMLGLLLTFIVAIGCHEWGHGLVARAFGIPIQRITLGFGKPLWTYSMKNGCELVIARWPLGGAVTLFNTRIAPVKADRLSDAFDKRPFSQRLVVLLAGSVFNLIAAWVFLTIYYLIGHHYAAAVIQEVPQQSIAAKVGIRSGDRILEVNHYPIEGWEQANMRLVQAFDQSTLVLKLKTKSGAVEARSLPLRAFDMPPCAQSLWAGLGIMPSFKQIKQVASQPVLHAMVLSGPSVAYFVLFFCHLIRELLLGALPISILLGPFHFLAMNIYAFLEDISIYTYFIALFSVSLSVVNLLPIPGLDGGSILYAVIEKIRRKPIDIAYEVLFYRLAKIAFCVFLVQLVVNDLARTKLFCHYSPPIVKTR